MTQILVTLENGADSSLIQRIIENIKGVFNTRIESKTSSHTHSNAAEESEWMKQIHEMSGSFNPTLLDMNDERTRYIMGK